MPEPLQRHARSSPAWGRGRAASGYLKQRELYQLGFFTTRAFRAVFLLIGTPWVVFVTG